ncbi:hypothetical protein MMC34_005235 [Xylographa carneopallida]|nr:hypothetical protein [Xylographa carneopallida]
MTEATASAFPYQEPQISRILVFASFFLLLNILNHIFDHFLSCGLIAQILLGVAFGTPGAQWLDAHAEEVISQLGYLGLILLVYEGGLSTSYPSLLSNLPLSCAVAFTGISFPITLSFSLRGIAGASSLQCFAAGAALCSTSLGTTLTVLATSGLAHTRLGVVLSSAAILDDVVGLVMVQVISNLGGSSTSFSAGTVLRPVCVSLGFVVVLPFLCNYPVKSLTLWRNTRLQKSPSGVIARALCTEQTALCVHTAILLLAVTAASFAGTSNLFTAYLAGAAISWWDSKLPHPLSTESRDGRSLQPNIGPVPAQAYVPDLHEGNTPAIEHPLNPESLPSSKEDQPPILSATRPSHPTHNGDFIYRKYYAPPVDRILKPLFFASIGFSIPITRLFAGRILWRGLVYAVLMAGAKLACGVWLLHYPALWLLREKLRKVLLRPSLAQLQSEEAAPNPVMPRRDFLAPILGTHPSTIPTAPQPPHFTPTSPPPPTPSPFFPAFILGTAMIARGEIGFLISSLAAGTGILSSPTSGGAVADELFLVVTWAVVLCTVAGPVGVGVLVRGWRRRGRVDREGGSRFRRVG